MNSNEHAIPVGDLVAEFLDVIGVTTVFGVVSIHNIPMLDAIGGLGVLVTSTGPGAANASGALVEAGFAGTPLLHLTGQTASGYLDRAQGPVHDVPDQLGMLESVSKAAFRVRSAETAFGTLVQAATLALTPPTGPVSVEIPIDIQRETVTRPGELEFLSLPVPRPDPGATAGLDAIAARVANARRPLLWTGNGAKHARAAVERWLELGIPLATSWNGRGVVSEEGPLVLGPLMTTPECLEFLGSVDLLVVAGCRLRGQETVDMSMPLPASRIHIDVDPAASGRTYSADLFHVGEAGAALDAIAGRLEAASLSIDPGHAATVARSLVPATVAACPESIESDAASRRSAMASRAAPASPT